MKTKHLIITVVFLCKVMLPTSVFGQAKQEGLPITVKVITTVSYVDGAVELAGISNSLDGEPGKISIEIIKPKGGTDYLNTRADKKTGAYSVKYTPKEIGVHKIIAYAPDKAIKATATFTTTAELDMADQLDEVDEAANKTLIELESGVNKIVASVAQADDVSKAKQKLEKVKQSVKEFTTAWGKIKESIKTLQDLAKKHPEIRAIAAPQLGLLSSQAIQSSDILKQVQKDLGSRESQGGDDCLKFYRVSEGCAAFSTTMNVLSGGIINIGKAIFVDKVWPKIAESAVPKQFTSGETFAYTQAGKLGLSALDDMKSISSKGFGAGMVGDLFQFVSNELFKKYCTEYKGPISGSYMMEFTNNGKMYMRYKITYEGKISLFAQKNKLKNDGIPKLSGYIEGNSTNMEFTDDVWAVEDKSEWDEVKYQRIPAPIVPMNVSEKDPGFGAAARAGIPGAFYFPLEAQMVQEKMVVKLMPAIAEFSDLFINRTVVVARAKTGAKNLAGSVFSYPLTTARFILTRTMRMPDTSPTVTLDIATKNGTSTLEKEFRRTETPTDTKVDFYLKLKMSTD